MVEIYRMRTKIKDLSFLKSTVKEFIFIYFFNFKKINKNELFSS